MTDSSKAYFAMFALPKPQTEHGRIVDVIRQASGGDFKQFPVPGGIGYVFMSAVKPWNLSFDRILLNTDSHIIFEIGGSYSLTGFGAAAGWLNSHFPQR